MYFDELPNDKKKTRPATTSSTAAVNLRVQKKVFQNARNWSSKLGVAGATIGRTVAT